MKSQLFFSKRIFELLQDNKWRFKVLHEKLKFSDFNENEEEYNIYFYSTEGFYFSFSIIDQELFCNLAIKDSPLFFIWYDEKDGQLLQKVELRYIELSESSQAKIFAFVCDMFDLSISTEPKLNELEAYENLSSFIDYRFKIDD